MKKQTVLILCTGNSARSQMAEGLLRHDSGDRFEVFSAGVSPTRVRPEAIAVMRELGIDLSAHHSKHVDEFASQNFDYVLTVCDHARELCPVFPGGTKTIHHSFVDPADFDDSEGSSEEARLSEEERLAVFRKVRDQIRDYLRTFPRSDL
jgi:arsenate reductase